MKNKENNPFNFGKTASNDTFTNREEDTKKLYQNLTNGLNTMLISPRRWGKSSLVEKVVNQIRSQEKKTVVIMLDLFSINSEAEFLKRLAEEVIKASDNRFEDWLKTAKTYFKHLVPKISFGLDPQSEFALQFDWVELQKNRSEILNLAEQIGKDKGLKFIICLDEFQDIANFKEFENLEKNLRASWQKHQWATYCLYGSKRHMMEDIFNNSSKPFYRFGDVIYLQKIKEESWIKFIVNGFKKNEKEITVDQAKWIAQQMKNHSWYVQQLSYYTYLNTGKTVTDKILSDSLEGVINANRPFFIQLVDTMSKTQIALLKAIANGERQLTSVNTMKDYSIGTSNNVRKNKIHFIQIDLIQELDVGYEFLDPVFEVWFRELFL